jgi:GNAT superfamily N-acetyltransferase
MKPVTIRVATESDMPTVAELWLEAAAWLRQRGSDQWQYPIKMYNIENAVAAQACWIVERHDGVPIGTITMDQNADPTLWRPSDEPDRALYLHRLVVRLDARANQLGAAILDWASLRAQSLGKTWLRLDAWSSNQQLHRYYLDHGFRLVRVVDGPDVVSGVLFERPADMVEGLGPVVVTQAGPQ